MEDECIDTRAEYLTQRHVVRMAGPRHVLKLEAKLSEKDKRYVFNEAEKLRQCGNRLTVFMMKRYEQLVRTKKYRGILKAYGKAAEDRDSVLKKRLGNELKAMQEQYNVTWTFCRKKMREFGRIFGLKCTICDTRAEDIWSGVEKILFSDGGKLHCREEGDLPVIRGPRISEGITVHAVENGKLLFGYGKLHFTNIRKPKDKFINDELAAVWDYLQDPEANDVRAVEAYLKDKTLTDTYRPCFATLKCDTIKGKPRVYILLTIEGRPKKKYRKVRDANGKVMHDSNGEPIYVPRHTYGTGRVGVDIGTQTIAYTSKGEVNLKNLAERGDTIQHSEAKVRRIKRAMDRSMRAMNPDNYNPDGTVKKGKKTWIRSNRYMKLKAKYDKLCRTGSENRHYSINEDINHLRELGDVFVTESKNASKLAKKTSPQSKEELADPNVKNKRRKRYGKSIQNRCPGYMQEKAKKVFESTGGKYVEVSAGFRASQYDHKADTYTHRALSERMRPLGDGTVVQRDMYSSFLLFNANDSYTSIDKDKCTETFDAFYRKEQARIEEIRQSGKKVMNSGIRPKKNSA